MNLSASSIDDDNIYYVRGSDDEQLIRVSRSGGESTMLADGLHILDSLVVTGGRLYWLDRRRLGAADVRRRQRRRRLD
jgi:hypothetical protein